MKRIFLLYLIFHLSFLIHAQNDDFNDDFQKFFALYNSGDLLNAKKSLNDLINKNKLLSAERLIALYNNLGVINMMLGEYDKALENNLHAEKYIINNDRNSQDLAYIYSNRGYLLNIKKSFDMSINYFEKSIRIYQNLPNENSEVIYGLCATYINLSIALLETNRPGIALEYLEKNVDLNRKYKLSWLALTYLNIAKCYVKMGYNEKAEFFYLQSIKNFADNNDNTYYRTSEVYFDYGVLLLSEGKYKEAIDVHRKALKICLKNYSEKHTLVSLAYKHLSDDYLIQNKIDTSLYFIQKSLISVVNNFNNPDIYTNPAIDSSLFDIRLLDNLKSKALAMDKFADEQKDDTIRVKSLNCSLATIELALQLIDKIRANYLSEESRIYLAENEKETYVFAAQEAYKLFQLTGKPELSIRMYAIAQKAKAAVLRNEITENEILYSSVIPDSLRQKQNELTSEIAGYSKLILEENRKLHPDSIKISLWKDALFDMTREKEKVSSRIEEVFPQFHDLLTKTEPVPISTTMKHLKKDENIVDYLFSNRYTNGKRQLFIFVVSHNNLKIQRLWLDSLFIKDAGIIGDNLKPNIPSEAEKNRYNSFTGALNYMYENLIKPVEDLFVGKKLIIIPDEEIGWLPFEAFIRNKPSSLQNDYEGLSYLINDYTISFGYSSSLLFNSNKKPGRSEVCSFSPEYKNNESALIGAETEINSIYSSFQGRKFAGSAATKLSFVKELQNPSIFHFAMHSMSDSTNSKFSYLMFDTSNSEENESRLYNYEISLMRINSPMVVLSACNSGSGTLYSGEGQMSLARSFILAGASSVIKTSWEINDETSASIMKNFYKYLSAGKEKNVAMRLAKLDFLKNSSPVLNNPYYWSAYEVLGDNAPVKRNTKEKLLIVFACLAIAAAVSLVYFKRRRISAERSR